MLRDGLAPFVLLSTTGGDIWLAPYDEQIGVIGEFVEVVDGPSEELGVALEFYVHTKSTRARSQPSTSATARRSPSIDLAAEYGIKAEAIESALGHGADLHH